ncbi:Stk1 family PASTA domain-containing Ser/Thr kinase [Corynebacterium kroppenstedtii]|uniref:Stk1 family PASTA domain-containing Ser/Thr kinase n=1 Tax=Corynebacterium sp. PCR 32 TaxID=3351342 RepID=UPI003094E6A9
MDSNTLLGGRYTLSDIIGTGGMSDVYAGTDTLLGRDVAVKMMRPDLARDNTFLERFRREALNAAKLNHHAIVAVYDTGQTSEADGSVPYIVMERVRGRTLRDIVRDDGPLNPEYAASVMADVADALHFSHEAGIVHRDVKPANIMITATGAVKVMDFGIARALGDATSSMTQTAAVIGTAQYLSPEQARGRSADPRSDIYASGCVLYELITGRPPFQGESPFSVAYQHVQSTPVLPSHVPGVSLTPATATNVDAVIMTAMAKDPADRYDNAADFADELRRLADHRTPLAAHNHITPHPSTINDYPPTTPPRHDGASEAATTIMPTAGAAAAGYAAGDDPSNGYSSTHASTRQPRTMGAPTPPPRHNTSYGSTAPAANQTQPTRGALSTWTRIIWTLVIVFILGLGGMLAWSYFHEGDGSTSLPYVGGNKKVNIPDVKNLPEAEAIAKLENAGFKVKTRETSNAEVEKGHVIDTSPAAGSQVPKGTQITLTVSTGKEQTAVPDLTGKDTQEASRLLQEAGLVLDQTVKEAPSDSVSSGQIIEQSPTSGSHVSKGSSVTITVSTGPERVRVPVVTGQSVDDARGNLEGAGFKVVISDVDSPQPEGKVLHASNEGSQLPKGSTVTLQVSRGNQVTMPNILGQSTSQALSALRAAGWTGGASHLTTHDQKTNDITRLNEILSQSVPAGQPVGKDATIDVGVGTFSLVP